MRCFGNRAEVASGRFSLVATACASHVDLANPVLA
jgi:hypothetical protein